VKQSKCTKFTENVLLLVVFQFTLTFKKTAVSAAPKLQKKGQCTLLLKLIKYTQPLDTGSEV